MGLLDRFRRGRSKETSGAPQRSDGTDEPHLRAFVSSRRGVEGFIEPRTTVSELTLLLVAHDGEWTRRRVPSADWAQKFAKKVDIPSYDAAVTGLPSRMREYNRRRKKAEEQKLRDFLDGPENPPG